MSDVEVRVRHLHTQGDLDGAVTLAIRTYGPEVFGFLRGIHGDVGEAGDVFSDWSERFWRTFDRFSWECSLRTWAYVLARNVSHDFHRSARNRRKRDVPLSATSVVSQVVAEVRTQTLTLFRTETKTAMQKLRDELPPEDQTLLILRVDRELPWEDLARVHLDPDAVDAESLKREAARLRKRFQIVKARLLKMGRERGLVGSGRA